MKVLKLVFLMLALALAVSAAQAGPVIQFSDAKVKVEKGETFTVDLVMRGFPKTEGGGVTIKFNPEVLQVIDVQVNDSIWSFSTREGEINNKRGKVSDILFSSYGGISGDAAIAKITVKAISKGKSRLKLKRSKKNPFAAQGKPVAFNMKKSVVRVR